MMFLLAANVFFDLDQIRLADGKSRSPSLGPKDPRLAFSHWLETRLSPDPLGLGDRAANRPSR